MEAEFAITALWNPVLVSHLLSRVVPLGSVHRGLHLHLQASSSLSKNAFKSVHFFLNLLSLTHTPKKTSSTFYLQGPLRFYPRGLLIPSPQLLSQLRFSHRWLSPIPMWHDGVGRTARLHPQPQSYLICFSFLCRKSRNGSCCRTTQVTTLSNLPLRWTYYFGVFLWFSTILESGKMASEFTFLLKIYNLKCPKQWHLCKVKANEQSVIKHVAL